MRTVLFTGSRGWKDVAMAKDAIDGLQRPFRGIVGDADGFDTIVWELLSKRGLPRLRFKPKWRENGVYHRDAGHARNRLMISWLVTLDPEGFCMAGWDGKSTGTAGCIKDCEKIGVPVWRVHYVPSLNE